MALEIKSIPVLKGKMALTFIKKADASLVKIHTVDFSAQFNCAKNILKKAQL
ncbi:hypothetical protein [Flavobacterium sp.]|jgi:hypothetical protein|uniref:hypothetical protein n=1 Tax=Flavobacterium sp. TaxID=239 RepID=UPI0037BFCF5E